jgi:ferredoxin-type protein NapH
VFVWSVSELVKKAGTRLRLMVQIAAAAVSNGYISGFLNGTIYQGSLKQFCVPGLNCYSCPGALGSCPIGALQAVLGSPGKHFSFYVIGFLMMVGALAGRFACGWLCPFGLLQELIYKIPGLRKGKSLPGHRFLKYFKYLILGVLVLALPLIFTDLAGQGTPWFCKLICPAGTLEGGWTLTLFDPRLREAMGWLFTWKSFLLLLLLFLSLVSYRPFCKYLCPLGAVYGLFNPVSCLRLEVKKERCTDCGACEAVCPMSLNPAENPGSPECIRCGKCISACKFGALSQTVLPGGLQFRKKKEQGAQNLRKES